MVAFTQYNNMVMLVDRETISKTEEEVLESECVVFNLDTSTLSPRLTVGSWVKRMGPWKVVRGGSYSDSQIRGWLNN